MTVMHREAAKFWWKKELPPDVAYMYHDYCGSYFGVSPEWKKCTWAEVFAKRKEKQNDQLYYKRISHEDSIVPCYIWVFKNTNNWFFDGWWVYIKTFKEDYGINFRHQTNWKLVEKAMIIFDCGVIPLVENWEVWCKIFSERFNHVGFKRKKNQGLSPVIHCKINSSGRLLDLYE
ncbi:MAG TPA: hypothetical protein VJY62_02515 [Bacteroidia bacterium]|nr:hypothetical protein [Bacteroidia bacterium]